MATFDDDMVRFIIKGESKNIRCKELGLDWPPPAELDVNGIIFEKVGQSQITDEMREDMTNVVRGAEYRLKGE